MIDMSGHNSLGITEELFNKHLPIIARRESELKIAREALNKARKAARADGVILKLFDRMRELVELTREEQTTELQHMRAYMTWLKSPVGTQFGLDLGEPGADESDEEVTARIVEDAKAAGYRAGLEGKVWEDENPHEPSSPAGQAWLEGYRDGQKLNAEALKKG